MSDIIVHKNFLSKKHRPLGVWILTIHAMLIAAFMLSGDSILVLKGEVAMFNSNAVPRMLLWAYLNIGIIIASILTWGGWEPGRVFFLFLTFTFLVDQGIGGFLWITHRYFGNAPMESQISAWLGFIGDILIPILYIWYFNKDTTKEYYKKREKCL